MIAGQRQARRLRLAYFQSVLSQEIGWFDSQASGALATHLAEDTFKIQDALSDKLGAAIQFFSMFVAGFVIGFIYEWKLTLVLLSVTPALAISGSFNTCTCIYGHPEDHCFLGQLLIGFEIWVDLRLCFPPKQRCHLWQIGG
jgi:ABC-type bacteriocin/lantibiotic exporter with double-glycine peptidase domain